MGRKFDHLADVEVFLNVVEHGSFSAAAVVLSTTPSAHNYFAGLRAASASPMPARAMPTRHATPSTGLGRPSRQCAARRRN